jgi:hypothetical protein
LPLFHGFFGIDLAAPVTHQDLGHAIIKRLKSCKAPSAFADQKIFGTRPCPIGFLQLLWFLTSPFVAHGMGSKNIVNFI